MLPLSADYFSKLTVIEPGVPDQMDFLKFALIAEEFVSVVVDY